MTVGTFHLAFAAAAFLMLGVMSLRFATRIATPPGLSLRKRWLRARLHAARRLHRYRRGNRRLPDQRVRDPRRRRDLLSNDEGRWDWLLVLEAVMLVAFGAAWFLKGTTLPGQSGKRSPRPRDRRPVPYRDVAGSNRPLAATIPGLPASLSCSSRPNPSGGIPVGMSWDFASLRAGGERTLWVLATAGPGTARGTARGVCGPVT